MTKSYQRALQSKLDAIEKLKADYRAISDPRGTKVVVTDGKRRWIVRDTTIQYSNNESYLARMKESLRELQRSEVYYWAPEIIPLVATSVKTFPLDAQFNKDWLVSSAGWWHFDAPTFTANVRRYLLEGNIQVYGDPDTFGDQRQVIGRLPDAVENVCAISYAYERTSQAVIFAAYSTDHIEPTPGPTTVFEWIWKEGESVQACQNKIVKTVESYRANTGKTLALWFAAASLWIQQKIIATQKRKASGPTARQSKRAEVSETLQVVALRRRSYEEPRSDNHKEVDWQHQWIVRGHWRQQYYPSLERNKPLWIDSFQKGPPDKPLLIHPERVYTVIR